MAEAVQAAAGGSKKKLIIIIAVAVLVAIAAAVAATLLLTGSHGSDAPAVAGHDGDAGGPASEAAPDPAIYVSLDPAFVVNFQDQEKHSKFLKAEISVVAATPAIQEAITQNMPAVRNGLVLLLSRQIYEELASNEGKEKLRADALTEVQQVIEKRAGKGSGVGVTDLYFSSLVMQ